MAHKGFVAFEAATEACGPWVSTRPRSRCDCRDGPGSVGHRPALTGGFGRVRIMHCSEPGRYMRPVREARSIRATRLPVGFKEQYVPEPRGHTT